MTFLMLIFSLVVPARAELIEKIVAVVNDQVILHSDIEKTKHQLQNGGMVDDLLVSDAKSLIADKQRLIEMMVNERLIDSEVKKQTLNVTIERVEEEMNQIAKNNGIGRSQLKQALKEQGVDFADYQNFIKKRLERHSLIERAITSKIKITDEDIAAYYLKNRGAGAGREVFQYKLAHILFLPKGGDVDGAKGRAENALAKLNSGKSFETLAAQESEDPSFTSGGLLGVFKTGEALPEIEKAVGGIDVNQTTGVVRTRVGFHIVKLLEKSLIPSPDFEQNKPKIQALLAEQAFKKQFVFWLAQRRQEAFIKIN